MKKVVINVQYGGFELTLDKKLFIARAKHDDIYPYLLTDVHQLGSDSDYCLKYIDLNERDVDPIEYHMYFDELLIFDKKVIPEEERLMTYEEYEKFNNDFSEHEISIYQYIDRTDPDLIRAVEYCGTEGFMGLNSLKIIEIPEEEYYYIDEYDGLETLIHGSLDYILEQVGIRK